VTFLSSVNLGDQVPLLVKAKSSTTGESFQVIEQTSGLRSGGSPEVQVLQILAKGASDTAELGGYFSLSFNGSLNSTVWLPVRIYCCIFILLFYLLCAMPDFYFDHFSRSFNLLLFFNYSSFLGELRGSYDVPRSWSAEDFAYSARHPNRGFLLAERLQQHGLSVAHHVQWRQGQSARPADRHGPFNHQ
jgi:hypothetical protein